MMNAFITTDLEGVCGVYRFDQTRGHGGSNNFFLEELDLWAIYLP